MLSVVIPVFNEEDSIAPLSGELVEALEAQNLPWEVLFVDDGSTDATPQRIDDQCHRDPRFRGIVLRRNFGKASALETGFAAARGELLVTMDGDLQDDPADIPALLRPILDDEADLVSGWKHPRRDPLSKTLPSRLYNATARVLTGLPLHDMNCGLKAYRREVVDELILYGDMHRYIPVLADGAGFIVSEVRTNHRPRRFGRSKYSAGRFVRGLLDLMTVLFITRYRRRPLHLIGIGALLLAVLGVAVLAWLSVLWIQGHAIGGRPLLSLGVLLLVISVQVLSFGLLAELMTWHYHRKGTRVPVRRRHGFDGAATAPETRAAAPRAPATAPEEVSDTPPARESPP